ncbi:hypothetical protein ACVDG5_003155 [Mesorhizobium sp. ORM6]
MIQTARHEAQAKIPERGLCEARGGLKSAVFETEKENGQENNAIGQRECRQDVAGSGYAREVPDAAIGKEARQMRHHRGGDGYLQIGRVDNFRIEGSPDDRGCDDRESQSANKLKSNPEQEVPASHNS